MTNKKGRWTTEEITFLKENYETLSIQDIATFLQRTYNAVAHKAQRVGLVHPNRPSAPLDAPWTSEEDAILADLYPHAVKANLQEALPLRSVSAIYHRANRLGIQRETHDSPARIWTKQELELLKTAYPTLTQQELLRLLPGKTWTQINHRAQLDGLRRSNAVHYATGMDHPRYVERTIVHCTFCHKPIERLVTQIKEQNYCDGLCYSSSKRNRIRVTCGNCGQSFERPPSHAQRSSLNFCNETCWRQYQGPSDIEIIMQKALEHKGWDYEPQYHFRHWHIDFALLWPHPQIAIQCDGVYWHGHPAYISKDGPTKAQQFNMHRDAGQNAYFAKLSDWRLLRFWEHEIKDNIDSCIERIEKAIKLYPPKP